MGSQIVAIVGRPNVGKSTLFNRLIGEKKSIIDNISGVTRDRIYGDSEWNGKKFIAIDTGGYVQNTDDIFEKAIKDQVIIAIDEADIIIFMVDVTTGITDLDEYVTRLLRTTNKPVILAVNKVDNHSRQLMANEFWSLGIENTLFLSSITGSGTGELLDLVSEILPEVTEEEEPNEIPRFAIVGQPNVGKSSFVNALMGEERNIVTDIAGTTRDSINSTYKKYGKEFTLIDTAGIRKKAKVHENLEFYSVLRAVRSIDDSDVCFLLLDASAGIEAQDLSIFSLVIKRRKGVVILVNKWDLVEKETNTAKEFAERIKSKLAPFNDVPILFISVLEKQRIMQALDLGIQVHQNRKKKITTSELNEIMQEAIQKVPPPTQKGKVVTIKYVTQLPLFYPAFAFFCNHPKYIKTSYKNYLENQLRKRFDFTGVPISIFFRDK
jgi:GTP-binding protein